MLIGIKIIAAFDYMENGLVIVVLFEEGNNNYLI
jgi:hypothetical protein